MSGETASGWPYLNKEDEPREYPAVTLALATKLEDDAGDHHGLKNLATGDHHPQYLNETRGNIRYALVEHDHDDLYPPLTHNHDARYLQPAQVVAGDASIFIDRVTTPGSVIITAGGAATGLQTRTTASKTTASLLVAERLATTITFTSAAAYRLYKITTSSAARVQLYTTTAKQTADGGRPIGTDATGDHGLVLEYVTTSLVLSADLSPTVDGFDGKATPDGIIPMTVTNTGASPAAITVTFTWLRTE